MKDYGGALKKLRKHFGYTQKLLAEKLNVSYQTVSKWETGTNQMDLDTVRVTCDVFGISLDAFINVADGATVNDVLAPKPTAQPMQSVQPAQPAQPEKPVAPPAAQPAQPAQTAQTVTTPTQPVQHATPIAPSAPVVPPQPIIPVQPAQPVAVPQPQQYDNNVVPQKPIEKTALILALVLFAVILVFIIATVVVFAPRSTSSLDDFLNSQKNPQKGSTVTVSYNLNGGSGSIASEQFKNGVVELPHCSAKRKGYKFNGWMYDGNVYKAYEKINGITDSNITVTATWKPITYTIVFDNSSGLSTMPDLEVEYGKNVKLPKSTYTLNGQPMLYWTYGFNVRYDDEDTVSNLCDEEGDFVMLSASWKHFDITVNLNGNGATGGKSSIKSSTGDPEYVESFGWKKYGYNLVGWKCGDKVFRLGEKFRWDTYRYNSYNAIAVWEYDSPYVFSVEYHCNMPYCEMDGEVVDEYTAYDGDGYVLRNPCEGKHVGYELDYISAQGTDYQLGGKIATNDFKRKNIEATVNYKPIEYDTVIQYQSEKFGETVYIRSLKWTYNTDISKWVEDTVMGYYGMHDEGYHIVDYKIFLNGTEYTGDMRKVTTNKSDKIVIEITQEPNSYTLAYYDGENDVNVTLGYDEEHTMHSMSVAKKVEMVGYEFSGWEIYGRICKEGETVSKLTGRHLEKVTGYMKWDPIKFTVQFDRNGGLGKMDSVALEYTSHYYLPECSFRKEASVFLGWECDGKMYNDGTSLYQFTTEKDKVFTFKATWGPEYIGDGTYDSPYQIGSYEQLYNLRWFIRLSENNQMYYALSKDIDCAGKPLYPIFDFNGLFYGNGHVIRNADLKEEYGSVGLFGYISGGVYTGQVYDLGMDGYTINVQSSSGDLMAAPIAAEAKHAHFGRVWASGSITVAVDSNRQNYIGGLVGMLDYSSMYDCFSVGTITVTYGENCTSDKTAIGGLAGYAGNYSSTSIIEKSYANMQITATAIEQEGSVSVGGIVGYKYERLTVDDVFVAGSITVSRGDASPICANYNFDSYFYVIYVCDDYVLTVGGETKSITAVATSRANLCSAEWLRSKLDFDFGDDGEWQSSGSGLPTLRGFAVQPSYSGGNV